MRITKQQPSTMPFNKYRYPQVLDLPNRTWPTKKISHAPIWCSVDLRDGNQALIEPMNIDEKLRMYKLLIGMGFKEIEVGFPSASQIDFDFVRLLIEDNLIPDDVVIQVLCQAREHLIHRTFESLKGCKRFIFHLYNSTSEQQRRIVFRTDKAGVKTIARDATMLVKKIADSLTESEVYFQYSPESFTLTETDFALEVCESLSAIWQPTEEKPIIFNLPATVEVSTPNEYADQIEWFINNLSNRKATIVSLHTHNDRGTTTAASELGLLAGADRVEGTLFGNGERTGNADLINLAMNLFAIGIDPELEMHNMQEIVKVVTECNKLPIHIRHPYAGRLVFTAFSGSHQDAIRKGMKLRSESKNLLWDVPYLPIDPADVGGSYEETVRVNSQSGKGGIAYILESWYKVKLPTNLQVEFYNTIQKVCEEGKSGGELKPEEIWNIFKETYVDVSSLIKLNSFNITSDENGHETIDATLHIRNKEVNVKSTGRGALEAFVNGLNNKLKLDLNISLFEENSIGYTSDTQALCMISLGSNSFSQNVYGFGLNNSTTKAGLNAVICALNRGIAIYDINIIEV
jgi:2-isopropylmalate synthase